MTILSLREKMSEELFPPGLREAREVIVRMIEASGSQSGFFADFYF